MRVIVGVVTIACVFAFMPVRAPADPSTGSHYSTLSRMAPADEYFGRLKESILEIRNRLDALDARSDDQMLEPGTQHELDDLQDAIRDWHRRYPNDPWLPRMMRRLERDYQRAGAASTPEALELIAMLQNDYPDMATADTVAGVFAPGEPQNVAAPQPPQSITLEGTVVDAQSGAPIAGAVVIVSTVQSPDPQASPFGTTGDDGTFAVEDLPATTLHIVVEPPEGSGYAPYQGTIDAAGGNADAGVIRLTLE
jgi:hypothetical protein